MAEDTVAKELRPRTESTQNLVEELYFGTAEKTVAESSRHSDSYAKPYNPDDLWQKAGDYSIYEDMRKDDQIHVGIQLKKDLVIGSGWTIECEDSDQQEIADDVEMRLKEDLDIPMDELLDELIESAYTYGFALSEKIFKLRSDQSLTFKELKTRHPDTWTIHTDVKGNVSKYEQHGSSADLDIKPESLIHYRINGAFQNPYGKSDLRSAYNAWFSKRHVIRYYSIFLEKHASPIPYAKYDANTPQTKINEMFDIIKRFQTKTAMVIPKNFEVDFLQSSSTGEAYIKGINLFNMVIGRALLMPDLVGLSGSETSGGAFALGKEQMEIFYKHIRRRKAALERIVNRHIVQPLIVWNYGNVPHFPKFKFNPISDADSIEYARLFIEAMKGSLYKPNPEEINHLRRIMKFPEGDVQEAEKPLGPMGIGFEPAFKPIEPIAKADSESDSVKDEPPVDKAVDDVETEDQVDDVKEEVKAENKKEFAAVYKEPVGNYSKKVNFKALETMLDNAENRIVNESKPILSDMLTDLKDQIQKKKIMSEPPKPERMNDLKLKNKKGLQQVFKKNFSTQYGESQVLARGELFKQTFARPMPSDEFLAFLEQETFRYVGQWEYNIITAVQVELAAAIKDGRPLSSVFAYIDSEVAKLGSVSIERYSRTKSTEVMNMARVAEFEASGAVSGYQYSAILDDRTSPVCRGLHGKFFASGTQPTPPMHFNCRSVLVPILIFEEFTPTEKIGNDTVDDFIKSNAGKGFDY